MLWKINLLDIYILEMRTKF